MCDTRAVIHHKFEKLVLFIFLRKVSSHVDIIILSMNMTYVDWIGLYTILIDIGMRRLR